MILSKVKVKNFLSVSGETEFPVDRNVTVLLGANDHGKSNLLKALTCLNQDRPIRDEDENWDSPGSRIDFEFRLTAKEAQVFGNLLEKRKTEYATRQAAAEKEQKEQADKAAREIVAATKLAITTVSAVGIATQSIIDDAIGANGQTGTGTSGATTAAAPSASSNSQASISASQLGTVVAPAKLAASQKKDPGVTIHILGEKPLPLTPDHAFLAELLANQERTITISRVGVGSELSILGTSLSALPADINAEFVRMIPRVELFDAFSGELQDTVTADQIAQPSFEFLQGIFFCAGLDALDCQEVFKQTDQTERTLQNASKALDKELRKIWTQGHDLHFELRHKDSNIEFQADDPTVKSRKARMSKRSAGVTQFFRLSMVLHARRKKHPANAYIYVFDEPGVLLHPKGQKDLLQVFEALAGSTQIIYATHSLFMLNQNFPERHRLIAKDDSGTRVDAKPYRANWKYAVDALGVRLTANILFSPNVLLVEGDSDPIYLYELFRVLNHLGKIDADANLLGILSYSDLPNLRFLIQIFKAEKRDRLISVLFDGDNQGKCYEEAVSNLMAKEQICPVHLEGSLAIEDYCLYPELFVRAVEITLRDAFIAEGKEIPDSLSEIVAVSWKSYKDGTFAGPAKPNQESKKRKRSDANGDGRQAETPKKEESVAIAANAGFWFKQFSKQLIHEGSSKVALARNYASLAQEQPLSDCLSVEQVDRARKLIRQISETLKLPGLRAKQALES